MKQYDLRGAKILIVDDNPTNLDILSNYLTHSGYTVFVKKNGLRALESLQLYHPDIILLDIVMPGLDGFETCRRLKENEQTKEIPVIFMTALADVNDKVKGFQLGAVDYITKPFQKEEVLERVTTHLTIKNLQNTLEQKNIQLQNALERERKLLSDLRLSLSLALPHELRTPLTVILGFSSFLTKPEKIPDPEKIISYGTNIYNNSLRLHRLIENALMYANLKLLKYTDGEKGLTQSDTTNDIARMIRLIAQPKAADAERQQDLVMQIENAAVRVNPNHFGKILTELLDNAFKNSRPGTPVELKASIENSSWILTISDQGRGMSEEQIANIGAFMQFERSSHEQQGLGLGLTLAQLLTKLEGGILSIESTLQEGTTVSLRFHCEEATRSITAERNDCWFETPLPERPFFRDTQQSSVREIQGYITSQTALEGGTDQPVKPYKILSIDQNRLNGNALELLLGPLGFELIEAFDEFDGIDKIVRDAPDIIFWDASQIDQYAFGMIQHIRHSFAKKPAKVIAFIDNMHDKASLRKLSGYCDAVWQKPVSIQGMFEQLSQLLCLEWRYK